MSRRIERNEIFETKLTSIRTRCPKDACTDLEVARMVEVQNLDVGEFLFVQCMNHERDTVLWQRLYVVASRRNFLRRTENIRGDINHADAYEVRVVPLDDWLNVTPTLEAVDKGPVHKWWVVDSADNVLAKGLSEDEAKSIAAGRMPIPEPPGSKSGASPGSQSGASEAA